MIKRYLARALAVGLAFACALGGFAAPAMATVTDPVCASLPVVNGSTTYNECSYSNATNIWLEHLGWGWDYVNLKPHAIAVDGATGDQIVNVFSLPPITFAAPQHVIADSDASVVAAATQAHTDAGTIAQNTAPIAGQAMTAISTTSTTNGVALGVGARGTEILLPTSSSTLTFAIEATATCGAAAPGDSITLTGPAVFDIPLASGVVVCEAAATAAHSRSF